MPVVLSRKTKCEFFYKATDKGVQVCGPGIFFLILFLLSSPFSSLPLSRLFPLFGPHPTHEKRGGGVLLHPVTVEDSRSSWERRDGLIKIEH